MRLPSALANGRSRARAPVATMMCLAASSVVLPSAPATDELAFAGELALAHHDRDLVLLHQVRDALVELLGDRAAARDDLGDVERRLVVAEAVGVGVLHVVEHLGRAQQRLGRDAAPVEADAAEQLALDDRGLEPELRGADRGDIAAGPGAEDDEVVWVSHCFFLRRDRAAAGSLSSSATKVNSPSATTRFRVAVALAGDGFGLEAQRGAALLQQLDIDAELVADRHRAGEFDRVRRDQDRLAVRPPRRERAAGEAHLAHQPAAEHAAIGVGVGRHGGDADERECARACAPLSGCAS